MAEGAAQKGWDSGFKTSYFLRISYSPLTHTQGKATVVKYGSLPTEKQSWLAMSMGFTSVNVISVG